MNSNKDRLLVDFKEIYLSYYPGLVRFATEYIIDQEEAENIVQDIFVVLWEQRTTLDCIENIRAYLYRLVKHKCIDFLRYQVMATNKKKWLQDIRMQEYTYNLIAIQNMEDQIWSDTNMDRILHQAIQELPGKCRDIFLMSRFENMSHKEIADKLQISTSTVNNQIAVAMKKLKERLKYLLHLILLFSSL